MIEGDPVVNKYQSRDIRSRIREAISRRNWKVWGPRLLGTICAFLLAGILVAGFWPFHSPPNQVAWLATGNGLHFGNHGTVLSSGKFVPLDVPGDAPCSFEIWVEPEVTPASETIFAFYAPGSSRQFWLRQSLTDIALQTEIRDEQNRTRIVRFYTPKVFRQGKRMFITGTSDGQQTSVYIDGVLARTSRKFFLSSRDFNGELIVANGPGIDNSWSGALRGLAFYNQSLAPERVQQHFADWSAKGRPEVSADDRVVALYLFDERGGRVIHNQVPAGTDLYIPDQYMVVDQIFLRPFWKAYRPNWSYWEDVLVNVAGFTPFGFLFCAYFSLAGWCKRPALATILLGFGVSLMIESLQVFLPTRDSDSTDIITNVLGTCLGVGLYQLNLWRRLIADILS
jgi:VanZ family protein